VLERDDQPDPMSTGTGGGASSAPSGPARSGSNTAPNLAYHDLRKWIEEARKLVSRTVAVLEPDSDPAKTIARIGGDADWIAGYVASLECRAEVLEPEEVRAEMRALGHRLSTDHAPSPRGEG